MNDLYSEIILDYYKNPRQKGALTTPTTSAKELNPSCGDEIRIDLQIDNNGTITNAKFDGVGCAISQAATSMLMEDIKGKSITEVKALENQDIYDMLGVEISAGRVKCALLGLVTLKKAAILSPHNHNTHAHTN